MKKTDLGIPVLIIKSFKLLSRSRQSLGALSVWGAIGVASEQLVSIFPGSLGRRRSIAVVDLRLSSCV